MHVFSDNDWTGFSLLTTLELISENILRWISSKLHKTSLCWCLIPYSKGTSWAFVYPQHFKFRSLSFGMYWHSFQWVKLVNRGIGRLQTALKPHHLRKQNWCWREPFGSIPSLNEKSRASLDNFVNVSCALLCETSFPESSAHSLKPCREYSMKRIFGQREFHQPFPANSRDWISSLNGWIASPLEKC